MDTRAAALVIIFFIVNIGAGAGQDDEWYNPSSVGSFRLENNPHAYMQVQGTVGTWIYNNRDMEPIDLEDIPNPKLVEPNRKAKPHHWFIPLLMGRETTSINLAFRSDNLYLSAFTNAAGEWFSFQPDNPGDYVVPGSTVLGFRSNYKSLVGDGTRRQAWQFLADLEVGPEAILNAVGVVSNLTPLTTPDQSIKRSIATLIVAFMESQRFPFIKNLVNTLWVDGVEGKLGARGAQLVVNWNRISCALRMWGVAADKTKWDSKEANKLKQEPPVGLGITTPKQAMDEIWPIFFGKCEN